MSYTAKAAPSISLFSQLFCGASIQGRSGCLKVIAAFRMNGVVRPHAIPTMTNPRVHCSKDG